MAHFYADIEGQRGPASRLGNSKSGITGHIRGWDVGVRVTGRYIQDRDRDEFDVFVTGGSNGHVSERHVGRAYMLHSGEPVFDKDDEY